MNEYQPEESGKGRRFFISRLVFVGVPERPLKDPYTYTPTSLLSQAHSIRHVIYVVSDCGYATSTLPQSTTPLNVLDPRRQRCHHYHMQIDNDNDNATLTTPLNFNNTGATITTYRMDNNNGGARVADASRVPGMCFLILF